MLYEHERRGCEAKLVRMSDFLLLLQTTITKKGDTNEEVKKHQHYCSFCW